MPPYSFRGAPSNAISPPRVPNPVLTEGKRAPAFTLPSTSGDRFRLTEHRGRWIVVFFYGKNQTAGARAEVEAFQGALAKFKKLGSYVVGISPDPIEEHQKLADSLGVRFALLADRDAKVASKYGAWRIRKNGGREYYGSVRATFLIDPSGKLARVWDNVRVKGHVDRVCKVLAEVIAE